MDNNLVPVMIFARRSDDWFDGPVLDFSDATEDVPDLGTFHFELVCVVNVLVLATGTVGVIRTARCDPVRRRGDDADEVGGGVFLFYFDDFNFDAFAGNDEGDEDDEVLMASNAVAAESDGGDVEF